jgi:uncharacterized membrane protein HdeD (DUF308 family)
VTDEDRQRRLRLVWRLSVGAAIFTIAVGLLLVLSPLLELGPSPAIGWVFGSVLIVYGVARLIWALRRKPED